MPKDSIRYLTLFTSTALASFVAVAPVAAWGADAGASVVATHGPSLVEEVVVSARRREERLQDVPMSVTSLSAETIGARGIDNTHDLQQITPGVRISSSGSFIQPVIRGIGSTSSIPGDESNVALYVDGVYSPSMGSNLFKLNNVERVEVLRGPQGTLFGRNAAGGAISITTRAPSEDFQGQVLAGYGSFKQVTGGLYVTGGWAPGIATDLAIYSVVDSGYVKDQIDPSKRYAKTRDVDIRSRTDGNFDSWRFSVIAGYTYGNTTTHQSGQPINGASIGRLLPGAPPPPTEPWTTTRTFSPSNAMYRYYGSVKLSADVGNLTISSQTSGSNGEFMPKTDTDGYGGRLSGFEALSNIKGETYTQEVQISPIKAERLKWVAGLYYINYNTGNQPSIVLLTGVQAYTKASTHASAGYGEATYDLTDRTSITAGLRYSYEQKRSYGYRISAAGVKNLPAVNVGKHWDSWTPRVIVRHIIPDTVNVYASYSKGFKSGTFNQATTSPDAVDPEHLNAFEVGLKTLNSSRYRASFAAYASTYKGIQVSVRSALTNGTASAVILQNAASAKIYGGEFIFDAKLADDWTMSFNTAYTHARYDKFPNATVTVPLAVPTTGAYNAQVQMNVSGNPMIRTPEWTVGTSLSYDHDYDFGNISATGNLYWVDSQFYDPLNRLKTPSHTLINAQLSWSPPGARYRLTVWGSNLLDEATEISVTTGTAADVIIYDRPRSVGVKAQLNF